METELRTILEENFSRTGWRIGLLLDHAGSPRQWCVELHETDKLLTLMQLLRNHDRLRFNQLIDVTAVDYLYFPQAQQRFVVVYSLLSHRDNRRLWVKAMLGSELLKVSSVCSIWPGAEWPEREVYDMFGIQFVGHPDHRRILTPEGFVHYPLRKDYPVTGLGERESFPVIGRQDA
jgi:NADH-quinone oxidoreductase subunit C